MLALASLLAWVGPASVRFAWRVGADPQRRLGLAASAMRDIAKFIPAVNNSTSILPPIPPAFAVAEDCRCPALSPMQR